MSILTTIGQIEYIRHSRVNRQGTEAWQGLLYQSKAILAAALIASPAHQYTF